MVYIILKSEHVVKINNAPSMRNLQEWLYRFALALIPTTQPLHAQKPIEDSKELTELRAKAESGDAGAQMILGT